MIWIQLMARCIGARKMRCKFAPRLTGGAPLGVKAADRQTSVPQHRNSRQPTLKSTQPPSLTFVCPLASLKEVRPVRTALLAGSFWGFRARRLAVPRRSAVLGLLEEQRAVVSLQYLASALASARVRLLWGAVSGLLCAEGPAGAAAAQLVAWGAVDAS